MSVHVKEANENRIVFNGPSYNLLFFVKMLFDNLKELFSISAIVEIEQGKCQFTLKKANENRHCAQ